VSSLNSVRQIASGKKGQDELHPVRLMRCASINTARYFGSSLQCCLCRLIGLDAVRRIRVYTDKRYAAVRFVAYASRGRKHEIVNGGTRSDVLADTCGHRLCGSSDCKR